MILLVPSPDKEGGLGRRASSPSPVKYYFAKKPKAHPRNNPDGLKRRRIKQRKRIVKIGTWNVRGVTNKLKEVASEIRQLNMDIVCITETKKKGQCSAMADDYVHIWSAVPKSERAKAVVSVLIKKGYNKHIQDIQFITERHLKIVLRIRNIELVIVAVYAPTNDATDDVNNTFYDTLDDILDGIKKHQQLILAGDLNESGVDKTMRL